MLRWTWCCVWVWALGCAGVVAPPSDGEPAVEPAPAPAPAPNRNGKRERREEDLVPYGQLYYYDKDEGPEGIERSFTSMVVRFFEDGTCELADIESTSFGRYRVTEKEGRVRLKVTRWDRAMGPDGRAHDPGEWLPAFRVVKNGEALVTKNKERFVAIDDLGPTGGIEFKDSDR